MFYNFCIVSTLGALRCMLCSNNKLGLATILDGDVPSTLLEEQINYET
jgi:hypothetical protein